MGGIRATFAASRIRSDELQDNLQRSQDHHIRTAAAPAAARAGTLIGEQALCV
jgi:hypothetical protein